MQGALTLTSVTNTGNRPVTLDLNSRCARVFSATIPPGETRWGLRPAMCESGFSITCTVDGRSRTFGNWYVTSGLYRVRIITRACEETAFESESYP